MLEGEEEAKTARNTSSSSVTSSVQHRAVDGALGWSFDRSRANVIEHERPLDGFLSVHNMIFSKEEAWIRGELSAKVFREGPLTMEVCCRLAYYVELSNSRVLVSASSASS